MNSASMRRKKKRTLRCGVIKRENFLRGKSWGLRKRLPERDRDFMSGKTIANLPYHTLA